MGEFRNEGRESAGVTGRVKSDLGDPSGVGAAGETAGEVGPARESAWIGGEVPRSQTGPWRNGGGFNGGFEGFESGDIGGRSYAMDELNMGGEEDEEVEEKGDQMCHFFLSLRMWGFKKWTRGSW